MVDSRSDFKRNGRRKPFKRTIRSTSRHGMIYAAVTCRGVEMRRNHTERMKRTHAGSLCVAVAGDPLILRRGDLPGVGVRR
jgi:hypothetical protein